MKYFTIITIALFIGWSSAALSVQEYVDNIMSKVNNQVDAIENNPDLFHNIYSFYQQTYPRPSPVRMNSFNRINRVNRAEIFKENLKMVLSHNADSQSTFKLKINEMSDWTDEESNALRARINVEPVNGIPPFQSRRQKKDTTPDQYDWTNQTRVPNAITPVKNQRHCGSCYAFAMVGALEKTYAQIYNTSRPLSPQQLIDCSDESGCEGGSFVGTFNYVKRNGDRLHFEEDYPSTPDGKQQDKCQNSSGELLSFNSTFRLNYRQLPTENEEHMKETLYDQGPLYVYYNCGLRVGNDTILREASTKFDHYASGVYDVPGCPTHQNMNHALVVVGYGTENGVDYWKVKNSWGTSFGEEGYIKIKRNANMCGIATWPYVAGLF